MLLPLEIMPGLLGWEEGLLRLEGDCVERCGEEPDGEESALCLEKKMVMCVSLSSHTSAQLPSLRVAPHASIKKA